LPGQCNHNSTNIGIASTPVIDQATSTIYVMAYTYEIENGNPVYRYRLHALGLSTLSDKVTPVVVAASALLSNNQIYPFDPSVSRQRAGLLEANGNIYAAFASFCDMKANLSRGWLLGWQAASLAPLSANHLDDQLARSARNYFLSSIWMSGYGVAADASGNLYFATGNSDPSGTSYDTSNNLAESIVKLSPDLSTVLSYFTPGGVSSGVKTLDQKDEDMGAGGVMLLQDQAWYPAGLATAAGKVGQMYLLNRNNMGGYSGTGQNKVLGTFQIGNCWCGQSYFQGADSIGRVVSSGGSNITVWKLQTSSTPTLIKEKHLTIDGRDRTADFLRPCRPTAQRPAPQSSGR
jgi:hypothetical protein